MKISMIPNKIVKLIHASKGDTSLRKWAFEPYDNNGAINVSNIKDQLVYKTENGGTEQLLPVNTSTPTTSYFDGTINYGTDTDVEFTYKQSSYTGQARIKSIKGNTLVWNQLIHNGNFTSTSWWLSGGGTIAASNNECTITISEDYAYVYQSHSFTTGHTVLAKIDAKIDANVDDGRIYVNYPLLSNSSNLTTTYSTLYFIGTVLESKKAYLQFAFSNMNGRTVTLRNVNCFDLTAMGLDTLTVDQFHSLFPLNYYAYNSGSLLNFNGTGIKTENKDQTDEYTLSLPISTYFPTGMKSAGSVYDELSDKAITRVGSVNLGSLTWTYASNYKAFIGSFTGAKGTAEQTQVPNMECAIYRIGSWSEIATDDTKDMAACCLASANQLRIRNLAYTDATTFKSAMSGVYLNYELATYTETDIQNASLVCKNIEVPCYLSNGNLVCDATEELTNESGFFDAKLKLKDSSSVAYSSKFKLHVEDL